MGRLLALTLSGLIVAGVTTVSHEAHAGGANTSACFKMTTYRAKNGRTYRVKMPRGQACFDSRYGVRNVAHIANSYGGDNPAGAIAAARSMNRRNIVFVVSGSCQSSCWIQWNFMRKKCWAGNTPPTFSQHSHTATGRKINPHSRSRAYWIRAGREGPGGNWVRWTPPAKYRCSETVMAMPSTTGRGNYNGRPSFRYDRGRTPNRFAVRSRH